MKIWLANVEETLKLGQAFESQILEKIEGMSPRFLFCVDPGDILLAPTPVSPAFIKYFQDLTEGQEPVQVLVPALRSSPYSLVRSVLADSALLSHLRARVAGGGWTLDPYMESPLALELAEHLGIRCGTSETQRVRHGLVADLNDKIWFKNLARSFGVDVIPDLVAQGEEELSQKIQEAAEKWGDRLVLKKPVAGGGLGNRMGSARALLQGLNGWYAEGKVLVEPWLPLQDSVGTLVALSDEGCEYRGEDVQVFDGPCWIGFQYPYTADCRRLIREETLRLAQEVWRRGARGFLNIDWGVLADSEGNVRCLALESNFRHNGLSRVLEYTRRHFPLLSSLLYVENVPVSTRMNGVEALVERLKQIEEKEGCSILPRGRESRQGVIAGEPPRNGRCSFAIFGPDALAVRSIHERLVEVLS